MYDAGTEVLEGIKDVEDIEGQPFIHVTAPTFLGTKYFQILYNTVTFAVLQRPRNRSRPLNVQAGDWKKAVGILGSMQTDGVEPNVISYSATFAA